MIKAVGCFLAIVPLAVCGTELLHPVLPPATSLSISGAVELDDDVYSGDIAVSGELAPLKWLGFYADGSFRFLGYSYEYSTKGYIHNYCNLHVNGFNETYLGLKALVYKNFGMDVNWQFPPGEGSQKYLSHRLNAEPFIFMNVGQDLTVGTSFRYQRFLEESNYKPGDEMGIKVSMVWRLMWNPKHRTGFQLSEIFLYQARIQESENMNMAKPYRGMDDRYRGMKVDFDVTRYFNISSIPVGFGFNYEIHKGTLFGFETGHRIDFHLKINN